MRSTVAVLLTMLLLTTACSNVLSNDPTFTPPPRATVTEDSQADPATNTPAPSNTPEASDDQATTSPTEEAVAEPTGTATSEATTDATTTPSDTATDAQQALLEQIEVEVVELRELELLNDINEAVITRAEFQDDLEETFAEDYSREQAALDAVWYWLLRLTDDPNMDLFQLQLDLLGEQVVGYYDSITKELVLITDNEELSAGDKVTMAHEIVHALQDQHFDLTMLDENAPDGDHSMALTALIEGDATLSMSDYLIDYLSLEEQLEFLSESLTPGATDVFDNAPLYVSTGLTFPYETGMTFIQTLYDQGGWAAVDAAFQDPPTSSEQIIHPELYTGGERDEPLEVDLPDLSTTLGSGWVLTFGDSFGEWEIDVMLETNSVDNPAASVGWGGAWFDLYQNGDQAVVALGTRWDSDGDAAEFAAALEVSFEELTPEGEGWTDGERYMTMIELTDAVILVSGSDRAVVEAAAATLVAEGI